MADHEILISCMVIALIITGTVSFSCLIIHFYKFFRSPVAKSLATKYLTVYCFILILIYIFRILEYHRPLFKFTEPGKPASGNHIPYSFGNVLQYLLLTLTFYKFLIALHLCWTFRKIAICLQPPSSPQNETFLIYCVLGFSMPLIYIIIRLNYFRGEKDKHFACMATHYELDIIRISRLIPIFGAFWYIRSASINKTEWWTNFSLHIRLLITLGGFSAVLSVVQLLAYVLIPNDGSNTEKFVLGIYYGIHMIGMILEGLVIAVCFTFRNDTFQSNISKL